MRASLRIARRSSRKRPFAHKLGVLGSPLLSISSETASNSWDVSRGSHRIPSHTIQGALRDWTRNFWSSPADLTSDQRKQCQQHTRTGKTNSLEHEWARTRDRILTAPTIQPTDIEDAQYLIQSMRINPKLATRQRIVDSFSILEKLCQSNCRLMEQASLGALLTAWRDHVFSLVDKESNNPGHRNPVTSLEEPLTCSSVMQLVLRCFQTKVVKPFDMPLSVVLHAMAKIEDPRRAPFLGEEMFHEFAQNVVQPGRAVIYGMVELWARSHRNESAVKAEYYLNLLQEMYQKTNFRDEELRPTAGVFCAVMDAHSRSINPSEAISRIQTLYKTMKATVPDHEMDTVVYSRVCHALATCGHQHAGDAARLVLDEMCSALLLNRKDSKEFQSSATQYNPYNDRSASITETRKPKSMQHAFTDVITVYAREERVKEAEELFHYMWDLAESTGEESVRPDVGVFNALLWVYTKTGRHDQADAILVKMTESTQLGQTGLESNWQTWNGVLASWADSGDPEAPTRIGNLIKKLMKVEKDKHQVGEIIRVNAWNKLLTCHARQGNPDQAEKVFRLLEQQNQGHLHPDAESHFSMSVAWSNVRNPEKSESYLRTLCDKVKSGRIPHSTLDRRHFNIVMEAWSKSRLPNAPEKAAAIFRLMESLDMKPDQYDYNSLLWAWGNSSAMTDHSKHVEEIYRKMMNQWKGGDDRTKPGEITFLALITAFGRSSNTRTLEQLQKRIFPQMAELDISPTPRLYNALMTAWSRHSRADKVEGLFQEMKADKEGRQRGLRPHIKAHTTRLQAWAKAGKPIEASNALREIVEAYYNGDIEEKPTTITFNAVIQAWLRSNLPNSAEKAEAGLHKMIQLAKEKQFQCYPDSVSYTSVISAYAKSRLPNAGDKAYQIFMDLRQQSDGVKCYSKHHSPSLITYAETIVALCRYPSEQSEDQLLIVLQELTEEGASFWRDNQNNLHMLQKAKNAIRSCSFGTRDSLLQIVAQLEK